MIDIVDFVTYLFYFGGFCAAMGDSKRNGDGKVYQIISGIVWLADVGRALWLKARSVNCAKE